MNRDQIKNETVLIDRNDEGRVQLTITSTNGQQLGFVTIITEINEDFIIRISPTDQELINQVDTNDVVSPIVDISLFGPNGEQLKFKGEAKICLQLNSSQSTNQKYCLSYIDTSVSPPEWKCQDSCLYQVSPSFWCGTTNHFTSFAVLLRGQSNDRIDECNEEDYYIFGYWLWDGLLALCVAGAVIAVLIGFVLIVSFVPPIKKWVFNIQDDSIQVVDVYKRKDYE